MTRNLFLPAGLVLSLLLILSPVPAAAEETTGLAPQQAAATADDGSNNLEDEAWEEENWEEENWEEDWQAQESLADPLEPLNRVFFQFNDKLYYWLLKPVARVYDLFFPDDMQIAVRNFFDNLQSPARAVNCLLQGRVRDSSLEAARFLMNSTVGVAGFGDFARDVAGLPSSQEDLGQTLAHYGAGGGFFIMWPFLGPSNIRDSIGRVGDAYMHPFTHLDLEREVIIGGRVFERVNDTSLTLGDYELFTETALDPYTAVKDAYQQFRNGRIHKR